jgi:hypothetical protein
VKEHVRGRDYLSFPLTSTIFNPGPCHEHECVVNQVNGVGMDGFVADYARRAEADSVGQVIGYHTAAQVPVYDALAREFLVCQRWFAAHPGPTFPNRFYTLTGRLNRDGYGRWQVNNPEVSDLVPVLTKTIFDHLADQGVPWRYYEHGYCFLRLYERYTSDTANIVDALIRSTVFSPVRRAHCLRCHSSTPTSSIQWTSTITTTSRRPTSSAGQYLIKGGERAGSPARAGARRC